MPSLSPIKRMTGVARVPAQMRPTKTGRMSIPASSSSSAFDLPVAFFFRFVRMFPPIAELCLLEAWVELAGVNLWEDDVIVTPEVLLDSGVLGVRRIETSEVFRVVRW